ncbi:MAG TPA: condensation domain-containing protein, partial [Symbiobacteriaceae bacterium]|nr:condensation domain-containing protein [Symbiobacteriaceae bacterium]
MKFAKADVYTWPLFEFAAYWLADGRIRILARIEALILDGTSNGVLLKELLQLLEDPVADLPPLSCSFRDYVRGLEALRETELYAKSQRYWLDRVKELPPAPEFPLASLPTPLVRSEPTPLADYLLTPDEWNRLKAGATKAGLTPSAVVLTALTEVLAAWSASPAFTIGLVASYRLPFHPDIAQLVGNFNQVTLLGVDGRGGTFQERARRLQLQLSADLEHMYFPGTAVLQEWNRLRGAGPSVASPVLANSLIEYSHSAYSARQLDRNGTVTPDGRIALVDGYFTIPQITFEPIFGVEPDGSLAAQWVSLDSLYPPGMFAAMFAAFKSLLKRLAAEPQAWKETGFAFAVPPASVAVAPARAVQAPPRAGAVRRYLAEAGLGAGETVALLVEPGADALAALAGIWAAGCAALPLNPDWPEADLRLALEQSGAALLLDLAEVRDAPAEAAPALTLEAADCLLWRPGKGLERFSGRSLSATATGLAERQAVPLGARVGVAAPPATDLWLTGALLALVAGGDLVGADPTVLLARPALLPAE